MEEAQDITKGFWVDGIYVPDTEGKCSGNDYAGYNGRIKVSLGKPKKDVTKYVMLFKTVLPKHVYSKLHGTKVERSRGGINPKVHTHDYTEINKSITSHSLDGLVNRYNEIMQDFIFILNDEVAPKRKLIMVKYKSDFRGDRTSSQNGSKIGKTMSLDFHFLVCYYNGNTFFDIDHRPINTTNGYDRDIASYSPISWTQEREDFFNTVYDNFGKFNDKLGEFFTSMNDKTIDNHISEFKLLG
jgi:hypothetical protein